MSSIRVFLIASVLATLTLFNFVAALQGYNSSLKEAEKLFDRQLADSAKLIANLHLDQSPDRTRGLYDLAYQVWHQDQLLDASSNTSEKKITDLYPGFGHANFNGYRWRTFVYYDPRRDNWIITAERTDIRFSLAENVIIKAVIPIVIGIPLVGLLIWLVISRGLKPLKDLSDQLKDKQVNDLSPVELPALRNELEQVVYSINELISRLGYALTREKRFTADAAHELRTPISALKIQLHNLREELTGENDAVEQLQSGVDRMQHLVEQLLSLYRSTPTEFSSHFTPVDLYQLAQEVIAEQHPGFEHKHQTLELLGSKSIIEGDRFSLQTLLQNLLSNANKYTPEGGLIRVTVEQLDATDIKTQNIKTPDIRQPQVCLKVEDSGLGIDPADYKTIYERFQRLNNNPTVAATPGCGLGLTIVSHIVELHHASISIAPSEFESGTMFTVLFNTKATHHDA